MFNKGQRFRYMDPGDKKWNGVILVYRGFKNAFYEEERGDVFWGGHVTVHDHEYKNLVPLKGPCPMDHGHG